MIEPVGPTPHHHRAAATLGQLYRQVWHYARDMRGRYIAALTLLAISQVVKLAVPWLAAQAMNAIQIAPHENFARAGLMVGAIFCCYVLAWAMHGPGRILERNVGLQVRARMADALYEKLMRAPLGWHDMHHSAELQHRLQQASHALYDFTQNQFIYLQNLINIVGPLIALWFLSSRTGMLAATGFAVIAFTIVRFDRALMSLASRENDAERRYVAKLMDLLQHTGTLLALQAEQLSRRLVGERLLAAFVPLRRSIAVNEAKWCAVDLMTVALIWALVAMHAWQMHNSLAQHGAVLLGSIFMVYQYAHQSAAVIGALASNFQNFAGIRANVASADPIWQAEQKPDIPEIRPAYRDTISIDDLVYRHAQQRGPNDGINVSNLVLARGQRIALIGPSGAGKSTLMRLLAGLYQADHATIHVDGQPLQHRQNLAGLALFVPQESEVFEATVRENLTFGATISDDAIGRAIYLSAFDEVLLSLPKGLETPLSEGGINLSGGQRQRLALARGLLRGRDFPVILLDEPTSALDQASEARVFQRLRDGLPDTCLVASVHRLSALEYFDDIVLMHEGKLLDHGTFAELFERQEVFRSMARVQQSDGPATSVA